MKLFPVNNNKGEWKRMSMEKPVRNTIEQMTINFELPMTQPETRWTPAAIAMELGALCMRFARVERVPRYDDGERESDVEHSFMLSMCATEIAHHYYPELDTQLIGEFAKVHDLIEVVTGDVATFNLTAEQLDDKEAVEQAALQALLAELPPYTADLLSRYETQQEPEARFVRAVDKLMPVIVDIIGQGQRIMNEDYSVHTPEELEQSHEALHTRIAAKFGEFRDIIAAHRQLCDLFEAEFI